MARNVNKTLIKNDHDRLRHYLLKFEQCYSVLKVLKFYFSLLIQQMCPISKQDTWIKAL